MSEENEYLKIEAANGSFYNHYKDGLQDFLRFAFQTAEDAIASGKLLQKDMMEVKRGLAMLKRPAEDLFPLLEKKINARDPSFFDECTVESIWSALGAVFLIAQHSGFTDSAKVLAHTQAGYKGGTIRGAAIKAAADAAWRLACLNDAIAVRGRKPTIATSRLGRRKCRRKADHPIHKPSLHILPKWNPRKNYRKRLGEALRPKDQAPSVVTYSQTLPHSPCRHKTRSSRKCRRQNSFSLSPTSQGVGKRRPALSIGGSKIRRLAFRLPSSLAAGSIGILI